MTTKWGRRPLALVAAGALALTLAGCGGNDEQPVADKTPVAETTVAKPSPKEVVSAAAARSVEAGTANVTMTVVTTVAGQSFTISGKGQMDTAKGALSFDLTSQLPEVGDFTMHQVVVDDTVYLSGMPGAPEGEWLKMSLDELGAASGSELGGSSDPTEQLRMLEQVSDGVQEAGTETVNGVSATKYTGAIDLAKAVDASAQQGGADADALRKQFQQLGLTSLPFELYVDDKGRPVRMTTNMETTVEGESMTMASTIDFTDWGTAVNIQAPANAVPFSEVVGQG
ncbi:MAG: DUF6612 family protein [Actinomycetes bacterium]